MKGILYGVLISIVLCGAFWLGTKYEQTYPSKQYYVDMFKEYRKGWRQGIIDYYKNIVDSTDAKFILEARKDSAYQSWFD